MNSTVNQVTACTTVSRIFMSMLVGAMAAIGLFVPESIHYKMIEASGSFGVISSYALCTMAVLALLDTCINDVAPPAWRFVVDERVRHLLWGAISVTIIGYGFVYLEAGGHPLVPVFFVLFGSFCAAIALMDTLREVNRRKKECEEAHLTPRTSLSSSPSGR